MAKIGLQRSGIDTLIGQRVAAGMPEHVWVDLKANLGFVAGAGEQLGEANSSRPSSTGRRIRLTLRAADAHAGLVAATEVQNVMTASPRQLAV
jgi:hypothetical protein